MVVLVLVILLLIDILVEGDQDLLTVWANLNLIWGLLLTHESVLHAVIALNYIRLLSIQHVVLGLLGLELCLEVVIGILSHLVLQVFLSKSLVWLRPLLSSLLLS